MQRVSSIEIYNDRPRPHIVWIEPWGEDYTMLPKEKLVASTMVSDTDQGPWFAMVETDGNTQLYVERGDYPEVLIDGAKVDCGHNRQAAVDAGIWPD
ncbi:MAG: hypothetical protein CMJ58_24340 [Planctomycetaceae bacterium]|nr:hypothetical protein [Planctomycetaceae bacterium]